MDADVSRRPSDLPKGGWGRVLVLAGSSSLAGAAVLTVAGALRTGTDQVVYCGPERAATAVLHRYPDAINIGLLHRHYEPNDAKLLQRFKDYTLVIGPGLTLEDLTKRFVHKLLGQMTGPLVIDADALHAVAAVKRPEKLWQGRPVILTPNRREYGLLAGSEAVVSETIAELATKLSATILAKGPVDLVSDGQTVTELSGGSTLAAKGGSGDVLAGAAAALLARGLEPAKAASLAAEAVKLAAESAAKQRGAGVLALDIAEHLDLRAVTTT